MNLRATNPSGLSTVNRGSASRTGRPGRTGQTWSLPAVPCGPARSPPASRVPSGEKAHGAERPQAERVGVVPDRRLGLRVGELPDDVVLRRGLVRRQPAAVGRPADRLRLRVVRGRRPRGSGGRCRPPRWPTGCPGGRWRDEPLAVRRDGEDVWGSPTCGTGRVPQAGDGPRRERVAEGVDRRGGHRRGLVQPWEPAAVGRSRRPRLRASHRKGQVPKAAVRAKTTVSGSPPSAGGAPRRRRNAFGPATGPHRRRCLARPSPGGRSGPRARWRRRIRGGPVGPPAGRGRRRAAVSAC